MNEKYIAVVDLGGTKILSAIISTEGKILSRAKTSTVKNKKDKINEVFIRIAETINSAIDKSQLKSDEIDAIVLGIPGSVNPNNGIVYLAPNLGWRNINVIEKLSKYFSTKILIENDANLGTLGIANFGIAKNVKNFIALFIGTGIGAGLYINGELYRGKNFAAGEIGHIIVNSNGIKCGCGNYGCFETEASRTAIARMIREEIKNGRKSIVTKLTQNLYVIKSGIIKEAIMQKDKVTIKAVKYSSKKIGFVIGNLLNLLDIEMVVLAGGVTEAIGSFLLKEIKKEVKRVALNSNYKGFKIKLSKLKDDSALFGGLALYKNYKENKKIN